MNSTMDRPDPKNPAGTKISLRKEKAKLRWEKLEKLRLERLLSH